MAPQCSSFVAPCRNNHKRSAENHFMGDETRTFVQQGNQLATAAAFLLVVGWLRELFLLPENTPGSCIWSFPPFRASIDLTCPFIAIILRCPFDKGTAVGKRLLKKFKFAASAQAMQVYLQSKNICPCKGKHLNLSKKFIQADTGKATPSTVGKRRWSGEPKLLKASQTYPPSLGLAIVEAWQEAEKAPTPPIGNVEDVMKKPAATRKKPAGARKRPAASMAGEPSQPDWLMLDGDEAGEADEGWLQCDL